MDQTHRFRVIVEIFIFSRPNFFMGCLEYMNERKLNTILDSERLAVVYPISITFILPTSLSNELWILSKIILQFTLKHTLATNHAAQEQLNIVLQTA